MATTIFNKLETYSQYISNISVGIFFLWNRQRRYFWSNRYFDPVGLLVRRVSRATRMKGHRRLNRSPPSCPLSPDIVLRSPRAITREIKATIKKYGHELEELKTTPPTAWLFIARPRITTV